MINDNEFIQAYIDRGELVPYDRYDCPEKVTVPTNYADRAKARGRKPVTADGWFSLSESPGARLCINGHLWGALSGEVRQVPPIDGHCGLEIRNNASGTQLDQDD